MPININEFEVVPGDAHSGPPASGSAAKKPGRDEHAEVPSPNEIERLMEQHRERCERVWAH